MNAALYFVSFSTAFTVQFITPIIPFLVDDVGLSNTLIGLSAFWFSLSYMCVLILTTIFASEISYRMCLLSYALLGVCSGIIYMISLQGVVAALLCARMLQGIAMCTNSACLVCASTHEAAATRFSSTVNINIALAFGVVSGTLLSAFCLYLGSPSYLFVGVVISCYLLQVYVTLLHFRSLPSRVDINFASTSEHLSIVSCVILTLSFAALGSVVLASETTTLFIAHFYFHLEKDDAYIVLLPSSLAVLCGLTIVQSTKHWLWRHSAIMVLIVGVLAVAVFDTRSFVRYLVSTNVFVFDGTLLVTLNSAIIATKAPQTYWIPISQIALQAGRASMPLLCGQISFVSLMNTICLVAITGILASTIWCDIHKSISSPLL